MKIFALDENNFKDLPTNKLLYGWLLLAVLALGFAGIFAFMIALARTPVIEGFMPMGRDYIYVGLVGHVILAFVLWFLAFEGFLWVYSTTYYAGRAVQSPLVGWASLFFSSTGVALVVVSAIAGLGRAELANYVPVLLTPVFYAALLIFALGILLNLLNAFIAILRFYKEVRRGGGRLPPLTLGMGAAGLSVIVAFICFGLSGYFQYSTGKEGLDFERLFWAGGHILQFVNTISVVTVWACLARITMGKAPLGAASSRALYLVYLAFVLPAPFIYLLYDTSSMQYKDSFTFLMSWGLGPSTGIFIAAIIYLIWKEKSMPLKRPGFSSMVLSMAVFTLGGVISMRIRGVNTIIPAHYHSEIGGITIAFMGLFYEVLPAVKRRIHWPRLAAVQPYLYFSGILLFVIGFYVAGAHGAMRKTYAGAQNLESIGRFLGLALMGFGGVVSIAGGAAFVLNSLVTLLGKKSSYTAAP